MNSNAVLSSLAILAFSAFAPAVRAQTTPAVTTLYGFTGSPSDGSEPYAALALGSDGNFYGTTDVGGSGGDGTVFQLTPLGVMTVLHNFTRSTTDGANPHAALVRGSDGNFYGTTTQGGASGDGVVFVVTPSGVMTTLHVFAGNPSDGSDPTAALVQGSDGNFYGTTHYGGATDDGTVFEMNQAGAVTVLHSFAAGGTDGAYPNAALVLGGDGNFYGTTTDGGSDNNGTVFQVTPAGQLTILHSFSAVDANDDNADGVNPVGGLAPGGDGSFYGTTKLGGASGDGTVFEITPAGVLTVLHAFTGNGTDGLEPLAPLLLGGDGNFYGTTNLGGGSGDGTIFQITPAGVLTTLHSFVGADGNAPEGGLMKGADGNFYGPTIFGGGSNDGTVFKVDVAPPVGAVQFDSATYSINESGGAATLGVVRAAGSAGAISVSYSETDGTAAANTDYQSASGTLSWADGDTGVKTFTVPILDRQITDGSTRTFTVSLTLPGGGASLGSPASATVTINENDTAPVTPSPVTPPPGDPVPVTPAPVTPTPVTPTPVTPTPVTPTPVTPTPVTPTPVTPAPTPVIPTILLVNPPDNLTVPVNLPVTANAVVNDPAGTAVSVQFYLDSDAISLPIPVTPTATYTATFTPTDDGLLIVNATVTDIYGNQNTSSHKLNVLAPPPGEPVARVQFLAGLDGLSVAAGTTIPITAQPVDASASAPMEVTFFANGNLIASFDGAGNPLSAGQSAGLAQPIRRDASTGTLYTSNYTPLGADSTVNLIAVAFDAAHHASISASANLSVGTSEKNPLGVILNSAHTTAIRGLPMTLNTQVSGGSGNVASIVYYVDAAVGGTPPPAPGPSGYDFSFTPQTDGLTELTVKVTDSLGFSAPSGALALNVVDPPTVSVAAAGDKQAHYGGKPAKVVFQRSGGDMTSDLVVSYKVKGEAVAGVDYDKLPGTVTIPAGATRATIKIKSINASPGAAVPLVKVVLTTPSDGSYTPSAGTAKIKLVSP